MKGRVFKLMERLQKVDARLETADRLKNPDKLLLLRLRSSRLKIKIALAEAMSDRLAGADRPYVHNLRMA